MRYDDVYVSNLEKEVLALKSHNEELKNKWEYWRKSRGELLEEYSKLQEENEKLKDIAEFSRDAHHSLVDSSSELIKKLREENERLKAKYEELETYAEQLSTRRYELEAERDKLRTQLALAEKALEEIETALLDRLLAEGPLSVEYAHEVQTKLQATLKKIRGE